MKKRFIFLMIFAMGTGCIFSQKGFNVQVAIQPGASFLTGDWKLPPLNKTEMAFKKSFTFGFEGGVNGGYNFTDNLGVSIGMFYASQGQKYKNFDISDTYGTATLNQTIRLSYLKIPLKFVFNTNPQKSISLTGFAGFYLGFLTGYKQTLKVTGTGYYADIDMTQVMKGKTITETNGSSTDQYDLIGKPFKSTNFGLTLGAGLQKKLTEKLFLQIMLNYQLGFGDVKNVASQIRYSDTDIENVYASDDPNRTVSHKISALGLMIGLKKCL